MPISEHPFGVPDAGDFRCGRCGTLLDGGTDEPVAARELRAEVERLRALLHGAVGFIERNPGPYDVADWLARARDALDAR